jgi:hypothetical protein
MAMGHSNGGAHNKGNGAGITFLRNLISHDGDECVKWPLSDDGRGYGIVGFNGARLKAHRVMCELVHGPAPTPQHHAAHSCGNGHLGCVNPRHLSWKTPVENMADSVEHGTARFGKGRQRVKLTVEQVREIMALKGVRSQIEIGERFGVSWRHIGKIHRGVTWVGGLPGKPGFKPGDPRNTGHSRPRNNGKFV